MTTNVYSPKDVDISFGGGADLTGWKSFSAARNSDNSSVDISADGYPAYTKIADLTGTMEVEVQQTNSQTNSFFSALQLAQDNTSTILFYDVTVVDKSGGFTVYLKDVHLSKPADQDLTQEMGSRTWMFFVGNMQYVPTPSGLENPTAAIAQGIAGVETIKNNVRNLPPI